MIIGKMVWRIGDIVDLFEQIDWIRENGFRGLCFHTSPGKEGEWQGFCPFDRSEAEILQLQEAASSFETVDVHAPFTPYDIFLAARNPRVLETCLKEIEQAIWLADRVGVETVTVHADVTPGLKGSPEARDVMLESLKRLGEAAARSDVLIGVELTRDYEIVRETGLPNVGLTVDVGHISAGDGAGYAEYGSIGGLIKAFPDRVFAMHLHDYDGRHDHLEVGQGSIDFEDVISALYEIGYGGSLMLEISPDRNPPEAILRSRDRLQELIERLGSA
jgi:sugar phosphate isomerase/epimerase